MDASWTVKCWNKEAEKLLGIQAIDIVGENLWEKFSGIIARDFYATHHKTSIQNIPLHCEGYWNEVGTWIEVVTFYFGGTLSFYFTCKKE